MLAGARVNADLQSDAETAGADTRDAMTATQEMISSGKHPTTESIYRSRPSASGSLLMSTTRSLGQMTTRETPYESQEPHLLHYDVEVSDEIVNDPMAYLTSDGHREMRLYYSRTAAQGLNQGVALQDSIWSQFVSSPLDTPDHGETGVDLRKLAEWVSRLEPTGVNDQKAMCILLKGLLRDLLSDKLKVVSNDVKHTRELLEGKMQSMAKAHADILHELHNDLAQNHKEIEKLHAENDLTALHEHKEGLGRQLSALEERRAEVEQQHERMRRGVGKLSAIAVKGKATVRKLSAAAVTEREENARLTAQLDEEISLEREMRMKIEDLEDDIARHLAHIARLQRDLKTMNYSNAQMLKKVELAEATAEEASRHASEWEERVARERQRNEERIPRLRVDLKDLLGEGGEVEQVSSMDDLYKLIQLAVDRIHKETGLSIYVAKLDRPTAGQRGDDGKAVLNYFAASKDAPQCKNRTLPRGMGVTYEAVEKNMNVHVRDVQKPTQSGLKVHLFNENLAQDAVSGSFGAIPIQVQYLSHQMEAQAPGGEEGAPPSYMFGALCFDNLNPTEDPEVATRRGVLESKGLAHQRGDGLGFTHTELDCMEDFAAFLAHAVDVANRNHDELAERTKDQINSWQARRYEALKHPEAWYIVTEELDKANELLNIFTNQLGSSRLVEDLKELRGYRSPKATIVRLVVATLLFASPHQHEALYKRLSQMAKEEGASGYDFFPVEDKDILELWDLAHVSFVVVPEGRDKAKGIVYKLEHAYRGMEFSRPEDLPAYRTACALCKAVSEDDVRLASSAAKLIHKWAVNMEHAFTLFEARNKIVAAEAEEKK